MKTITKLAFLTAAVAALGTSAAFADDQQLQNQLALQRAQAPGSQNSTTIAVYADRHRVSRCAMQDQRSEVRFELRMNAQGQQFGVFVPVK